MVTKLSVGIAAIVVGFGILILWIEADRLMKVRCCLLTLAKLSLGIAAIVVSFEILRIKVDRLVIVRDRLFILA